MDIEQIKKRHEAAKTFVGRIYEFRLTPSEPSPLVRGECTGAKFTGLNPSFSDIPDYELTLRGRTGKTVTISMTESRAYERKDWKSKD
jgi:hypothetical protein